MTDTHRTCASALSADGAAIGTKRSERCAAEAHGHSRAHIDRIGAAVGASVVDAFVGDAVGASVVGAAVDAFVGASEGTTVVAFRWAVAFATVAFIAVAFSRVAFVAFVAFRTAATLGGANGRPKAVFTTAATICPTATTAGNSAATAGKTAEAALGATSTGSTATGSAAAVPASMTVR